MLVVVCASEDDCSADSPGREELLLTDGRPVWHSAAASFVMTNIKHHNKARGQF